MMLKDFYARLDWVTAQDNCDAQRLYERHGGRRFAASSSRVRLCCQR